MLFATQLSIIQSTVPPNLELTIITASVVGGVSILGGIGTATQDFDSEGDGKVWLEGEAWSAHSDVPIEKDQNIIVTAMDGLTLEVEPAPAADSGQAQLQT